MVEQAEQVEVGLFGGRQQAADDVDTGAVLAGDGVGTRGALGAAGGGPAGVGSACWRRSYFGRPLREPDAGEGVEVVGVGLDEDVVGTEAGRPL